MGRALKSPRRTQHLPRAYEHVHEGEGGAAPRTYTSDFDQIIRFYPGSYVVAAAAVDKCLKGD